MVGKRIGKRWEIVDRGGGIRFEGEFESGSHRSCFMAAGRPRFNLRSIWRREKEGEIPFFKVLRVAVPRSHLHAAG